MKIIIIGGGKLAYYLVKTLLPLKHKIVVIELRKEHCEKIATDLEVDVLNGDGTSMALMEQAGAMNADFLISITGKDENNLIACEIAKKRFNVKQTVAKVNNPKNIGMFYKLGIDRPVSSTQIIADMIEQQIEYFGLRKVYKIPESSKSIVEFTLSDKSDACNKALKNFKFPGNSKVVLITRRNDTTELPNGNVVMYGGDKMLMVCDESEIILIWKALVK